MCGMPKQKKRETLKTFTEATVSQICQDPNKPRVSSSFIKKHAVSL